MSSFLCPVSPMSKHIKIPIQGSFLKSSKKKHERGKIVSKAHEMPCKRALH